MPLVEVTVPATVIAVAIGVGLLVRHLDPTLGVAVVVFGYVLALTWVVVEVVARRTSGRTHATRLTGVRTAPGTHEACAPGPNGHHATTP